MSMTVRAPAVISLRQDDDGEHVLQIEFENDTAITLTISANGDKDWGIWSGRNSYEWTTVEWLKEWVEHATGQKPNPRDERNWPRSSAEIVQFPSDDPGVE
jgi:hypothetical protein